MKRERAIAAQRVGVFLAVVEACLLAAVAALHFGLELQIGDTRLEAPFLYPAGLMEAFLALALFVSVLLPGAGGVRAGRVLAAQILSLIGIFVGQIALMRGATLATARDELLYAVVLVLAVASIILVASPGYRYGRHLLPR
jgi:hypothetical protein